MRMEAEMNDVACPWCEAPIALHVVADEQTCRECGTTWTYEDDDAVVEPPLAA